MSMNWRFSRVVAVAASATLALLFLTVGQAAQLGSRSPDTLSKIRIKNFGTVNEKLYRGAQPSKSDYADLASLGVKTVIDLEQGGERNEQSLVETAGMKFRRIEMSDTSRPTDEQIDKFLTLVRDPVNQPVFIHCHGGRHRTGATTAIYRMVQDGWNADQAYAEMKQYGFESGFGHGSLKDYVYDYYVRLDRKAQNGVTAAVDK